LSGVPIKEVKMAQRFYYLATKFEDRIPAAVVGFAKEVCNRYTKMAKAMNLKLNDQELIDSILK
jgi:hypothetical protein